VATLLADPPAAQAEQQSQGQAPGPDPADAAGAARRACANCGAPLADGQDWCLRCGTAAPGSLAASSPGWRSGAAVVGAVAVLVAGAGAAAYAAFGKSEHVARATPSALARVPATTPPAAAVPPPAAVPTPAAVPRATTPTPKVGAGPTVKPTLPLTKPPKISLPAVTPKVTPKISVPIPAVKPTPATTTPSKPATGESPAPGEPKSAAILLDTNAASTYNPSALPASGFGDPSLAIDGETSTGWTSLVDRATAPRTAAGLAIDLRTARRLGALALVTSTPGMTVQVYGAPAGTLPAALSDPSWVRLSPALVEKKRRARLTLAQPKRPLRFVLLWISKAPAGSRRVSVNEIELFPPGK
jgi:hypothetical protein